MSSIGKYLQPLGFGNLGDLKDYAHASRLYLDDFYALAPKTSWIYYVEFDINPSAIIDQTWANQQRFTEVGMLVKSSDLPRFEIQTETLSQYNRKVVIQKGIEYNPVSMTFHDDQTNVVHNLWLNYFRYYFADSQDPSLGGSTAFANNSSQAYGNNKFNPPDNLFNPVNYGLNSSLVDKPFFRSATIYQMNRQIFTSYKLINPIIKSWEHDKLDQSDGGKFAESKMTLQFETVLYGAGRIRKDTPTGFALFHYDNSPSPLSIAGGGNSSIFGPGGIVDGAIDVFGDVDGFTRNSEFMGLGGPGDTTNALRSSLGTAIKSANLINNLGKVSIDSLKAEGYSLLTQALRRTGRGSLNGLGVNLNLNLGNNIGTSGEFQGTPVSVITAQAIGQDFTGGIFTSPQESADIPIDTDASKLMENAIVSNQEILDQLKDSKFTLPSIDTGTVGILSAKSKYFDMPKPLADVSPIEFSNIDFNSSTDEKQQALDTINTLWATDLDYISSQSTDPNYILEKLTQATSPQEFQSIQQQAEFVLTATKDLQSSINNKYSSEYQRLNSLLQLSQNNPNISGTTGVA